MSRITEGKVVIFSAPSGAGKSTIIGRLARKISPPRIFHIVHEQAAARKGSSRTRVLFPQQRRVQSARGGRGVRRMGGGLSRNLLRHAAQRTWTGYGRRGAYHSFSTWTCKGGDQSQENASSAPSALLRLHHAAVGRGAADAGSYGRGTDARPKRSPKRVAKAEQEIAHAPQFDRVDRRTTALEEAVAEAEKTVAEFIG